MVRKILLLTVVSTLLLTACGAQGTPTLSAEQVQGTAIGMASTMVALTQAAIPTNTPVPPTETASPTPLPTFTLEPLPTIEVIQATATSQKGKCDGPLNVAEAGPKSQVRFENQTGGTVTLSLYLAEGSNLFGQCGYLSYKLAKNEKLVLQLPKGNYFAFALIAYPDGSSGNASGYVNNRVGDDHGFEAQIRKDVIYVP